MPAILPCNEVCADGTTVIAGPYVPNPCITHYRPFEVPRDLINTCPTVAVPCNPWWFFRAHGFDLNFPTPADVPPPNELQRWQFPSQPATLAKVEVRWYEYSESRKQQKGSSNWSGRLPTTQTNQYEGGGLVNNGGIVENRIVMDIGNGVNVTIPPTGRIEARILLPDLNSYLAAGNELPPETPSEATMLTRITPAGFLTDGAGVIRSGTFTQTLSLFAPNQLVQTIPIPPLAQYLNVYTDSSQPAQPTITYLYKNAAPLDIVLGSFVAGSAAGGAQALVPENAGFLRVDANGYLGPVTAIFALEF